VPGVSIGVVPKVGSVIEYTFPDEIGHLAYVEAVFPDESIVLSEANYPDRGIYNERTLGKEEWTALNPVFIQVV
jgi:surface antigen